MTSKTPDSKKLVINTSPMIALVASGNQLDILQRLYTEVIVPNEVAQEMRQAGEKGLAVTEFISASWLNCLPHPVKTSLYLQNSLDPGEAAVIQTALDRGIETVCIDEAAGRRVARLHGLKITGSIGVLIRAKQKGMNISITESIHNMRTNGIWISDHLAGMAIKLSGE